MFCLQDFEDHAKRTLDTNTWCFHSTGAMNEQTLKDNNYKGLQQVHNTCHLNLKINYYCQQ